MARIIIAEESVPATPSAGSGVVYVDSTSSKLSFVDDGGRKYVVTGGGLTNASIANQTVNAADTYLTDSDLLIPSFGLQARTRITWQVSASKTGAGVATPIYNIRVGSARTTSDTARLVLTGPAQTAIADIGTLTVMATVRSIGAAGVIQGTAFWTHRRQHYDLRYGLRQRFDGSRRRYVRWYRHVRLRGPVHRPLDSLRHPWRVDRHAGSSHDGLVI